MIVQGVYDAILTAADMPLITHSATTMITITTVTMMEILIQR